MVQFLGVPADQYLPPVPDRTSPGLTSGTASCSDPLPAQTLLSRGAASAPGRCPSPRADSSAFSSLETGREQRVNRRRNTEVTGLKHEPDSGEEAVSLTGDSAVRAG